MKLDREEVMHIAALAKLGMTEEDVSTFSVQLSEILESFEVLNSVDTTGVPPTAQPNSLCNVMREDAVTPSLSSCDVLANAPRKDGEFFRIHAVLE
ncbi:MAG: Asp-tRNA(Asn)/Glu-tRNA(Gln) amidotransferase subunit GatC [Dehalococcoidia bacterium]|nr:Asp-tRNA(Asn)/Glu-tRNA(Gln) amidotransferase subunit GatC [Dehalococcoidia bacterium]